MDRHEKALHLLQEGAVIPAIPLVLDEKRSFCPEKQRVLVGYYLEAGVGGVAVGVHTTQFEIRRKEISLLEPVLRETAAEMEQYERAAGKTVVRVAGACGPEEQAVQEAKLAKELGYDAVLLSPGGLGELSEEQLLQRTRSVAAVMPVIGFYLQTAVGGRKLSYSYWKALADIEQVVAVKAASFDRYQTLDLVRGIASSKRGDQVTLYTGNDDHIVLDLLTEYQFELDGRMVARRFAGGLLGHWSFWTKKAVELFEQIRSIRGKGQVPEALLTLAMQVTDTNGAVFDVANQFSGCIAGIHEILRRQGLLDGIWCLDEKETLSPGQKEEIDRVCRMYPHLNDDAFVKAYLNRRKA